MSSKPNGFFNRCNISEDLIKRFASLRATSPTKEKKVELEKLLLSVPLDDDVAAFSDSAASTQTKRGSLPLYDNYESNYCLPSSGYKSDSEKRYPIRTCNSANQSPTGSPESTRRANVRRTQSLNANTVTDRIWAIREKLAQSRKDKKKVKAEYNNAKQFEFRSSNTSRDSLPSNNKLSTSIRRSRSFNPKSISDSTEKENNTTSLDPKSLRDRLKSTSVSHIKPSDIDNIRKYFGGTSWKRPNTATSTQDSSTTTQRTRTISDNTSETTRNSSLKSRSFSTLQDAWERSAGQRSSIRQRLEVPVVQTQHSFSDADSNDIVYRRRERRRTKRESANERSDSETEAEDGQLTQAALERLERRQRIASRRTGQLARRQARYDSESADENNNETSSDKTLDSGVYELTLSNLSENISKLSQRYDSDEFLLDDCLSPKSGYSSATESIAESTTTFYDSTEEDMDNRKKRPTRLKTKVDNTNVKTAVLNSSRLKMSAGNTLNRKMSINKANSLKDLASTSKEIEQTSLTNQITKKNHDSKLTNKKLESPSKTNNKSLSQVTTIKDLNTTESTNSHDEITKQSPNKLDPTKTVSSPHKSTESSVEKTLHLETTVEKSKVKTQKQKLTDNLKSPTTPTISSGKTSKSLTPTTPTTTTTPSTQTCESQTDNTRKSPTQNVSNTNNSHSNNHSKLDRKASNSLNKGINSKQSKEQQQQRIDSLSQPQRKTSVHHKGCAVHDNSFPNHNSNKNSMSSTRRKSSTVSPVKRKESLQQKTAQICASIPLSKTTEEKLSNQDKDKQDKTTLLQDENLIKIQENSSANNSIKSVDDGLQKQDQNVNTDHSEKISNEKGDDKVMDKHLQSKFYVNRARSSIDETNSNHRLVRQGESIGILLSFNEQQALKGLPPSIKPKPTNNDISDKQANNPKPVTTQTTTDKKTISHSDSFEKKTVPTPLPKPKTEKSSVESLHKGVQVSILTGDTVLSGEVIKVSDTSKQITINENIVKQLGGDILQDIQFTYPKYLLSKSTKVSKDEEASILKEKLDPVQLKMENTRLQQLLFEVEKARAGSVKALLHVNTMLNKVQGENTKLEGEIKVCTQEKDKLTENIKNIQEKEGSLDTTDGVVLPGDNAIHKSRRDTVNNSLSIIVDNWKKEKKELMVQLNTTKTKEDEAEKTASRLRVQYKKVKEQLEHSNNAFTMTLQNNLDATKRMEEELKTSLNDKQELLKKCNEGNKYKRELEKLQQEMEEIKQAHEELEDEKDQMDEKIRHLEKQKRHLLLEEEELHEQVAHSQEIIEKLTDVEDELKGKFHREVKEKEYLEECLNETGQILYQLKNNEKHLAQEKELLLDDLEAELEEKETLQTTLSSTMDEHKEIMDRLQNMTNIHITVKESLQQANKKEKNYQDQIESLTKTNLILHYTLEKEKEERLDLQEMFDIIECDHRKHKSETMLKIRDMEEKIQEMTYLNHQLSQDKEIFEKEAEELKTSLEQEEEANAVLREKHSRLEQLKEALQAELDDYRDNGEEIEKNLSGMTIQQKEMEVDLKTEKERNQKLTSAIEDTEILLERIKKQLHDSKIKIEEYRCDHDDMHSKLKERHKKIRDLESRLAEATELRDKYQNRMNYYETETKSLRKKVNEQTEEIGTLQIESQRFARERDTNKRNCDMAVRDFDDHKTKCTETLKRLKEEIIELGSKIVEKDRLAMKQKETCMDQIDSSKSDLQFIRNMIDTNIQNRSLKRVSSNASSDLSNDEKMDINFLRNSHDKFRDEFQSHVDKLEDMLKHSTESNDIVTVVQSPMSKIKLEELKQFRNEVYELHSELANIKTKFSNLSADITSLKFDKSKLSSTNEQYNASLSHLETELSRLNDLITKIECRHKAVMSSNALLLQKTLTNDELTAKDLVKKFQVISLEGENRQLRTLLGILKKRYDFNESDLATELQKINDDDNAGGEYNGLTNGSTSYLTDESEHNGLISPSRSRKSMSPRTDSNLRYSGSSRSSGKRNKNHSFVNELLSADSSPPPPRKYSRDLHLRSSGVSSYSSDEADDDDDYSPPRGLPKRYNSTTSRSRRPRT